MFLIIKKWSNPGLFFIYFRSLQTNITIFTTNQCEKMSCPSSIRRQDSNPRPLERESLPITTRPGLLFLIIAFQIMKLDQFVWEFTAKMWPRLQVPNLGIYKVLWNSPLVNSGNFAYSFCWTWIAHKGRLYSRMSFIYKYKTSTFTPFVNRVTYLI